MLVTVMGGYPARLYVTYPEPQYASEVTCDTENLPSEPDVVVPHREYGPLPHVFSIT